MLYTSSKMVKRKKTIFGELEIQKYYIFLYTKKERIAISHKNVLNL
jgi:hypothetical protein